MPQSLLTPAAPSVAQSLAFTADNGYDKAAGYKQDHKDDILFHDVMKEKYLQQEANTQKMREAYRKDAEIHKQNNEVEARESAEKEHALKAEHKREHTAANDVDPLAETITTEATEDNTLAPDVSVVSNPLQQTQLSPAVQNILRSVDMAADHTPNLTIDAHEFDALSDLEKLQFLSVMNSLQIDGGYEAANGGGLNTIEGFIDKLVQQYAQNDPSATLSNLTPQQITNIRNHLAQMGAQMGAQIAQGQNGVVNSLLALQTIDPDTGLSRGGPGGIHAGLDRQEIIKGALNASTLSQISDILAGMAQLAQPAVSANTRLTDTPLPQSNNTPPTPDAVQNSTQADQQLAARLNNLASNGASSIGSAPGTDSPDLLGLEGEMSETDFDKLLSRFTTQEKGYTPTTQTRAQVVSSHTAASTQTESTATTPPPSSSPAGFSGLDTPLSVADSILQELGLTGVLVNGTATQGAGLANIVTSTQQAGAAHPAAQTVAATLHKTANGGVNKAITIRLDPPELGRVEIKMSFEPGSQIKAVLTVENPETHLMMQRDQQILERALQDAGFDTDGSLHFELAQDGHNFDQNGGHDSFHQGQNGEQVPEDDVEITETTMTWSENAQTGHISYNLLA